MNTRPKDASSEPAFGPKSQHPEARGPDFKDPATQEAKARHAVKWVSRFDSAPDGWSLCDTL